MCVFPCFTKFEYIQKLCYIIDQILHSTQLPSLCVFVLYTFSQPPGEQAPVVQTARLAPPHFGDVMPTGNLFVMPAAYTTNYTM